MTKEAITANKINPLLKKRWSPRAFDDRPIEKEKLLSMLESARWAPSASNIQPWHFFVGIKGDETYSNIFETLVEFNQMWTKNIPVLILNCGKTTSDDKGTLNATWQYDLGQAVAQMSVQATDEGLFVHQMSGFDASKAAGLFQLPEDIQAVSVTAVGYLGDPSILHPRMQKSELAERIRKEMDTFVHSNIYGVASDLVK